MTGHLQRRMRQWVNNPEDLVKTGKMALDSFGDPERDSRETSTCNDSTRSPQLGRYGFAATLAILVVNISHRSSGLNERYTTYLSPSQVRHGWSVFAA